MFDATFTVKAKSKDSYVINYIYAETTMHINIMYQQSAGKERSVDDHLFVSQI